MNLTIQSRVDMRGCNEEDHKRIVKLFKLIGLEQRQYGSWGSFKRAGGGYRVLKPGGGGANYISWAGDMPGSVCYKEFLKSDKGQEAALEIDMNLNITKLTSNDVVQLTGVTKAQYNQLEALYQAGGCARYSAYDSSKDYTGALMVTDSDDDICTVQSEAYRDRKVWTLAQVFVKSLSAVELASINLFPYKAGSKGASAIAAGLGIKKVSLTKSKYQGIGRRGKQKTIINWGSSQLPPNVAAARVINTAEAVGLAANKLKAFRAMEGHCAIPDYTTDIAVAQGWIDDDRCLVVARQKLTGHSGEGIVICGYDKKKNTTVELVPAPLYVRYIPKVSEFRIHVMAGNAISNQKKQRSLAVESKDVNWQVRNHANGFIFARNDIEMPDGVIEEAIKAVAALGLDFGAVDIVYNGRTTTPYVIEVNTACGLEGTTLDDYVNGFKALLSAK